MTYASTRNATSWICCLLVYCAGAVVASVLYATPCMAGKDAPTWHPARVRGAREPHAQANGNACPVAFQGPDCTQPTALPACIGKVWTGGGWTLSRAALTGGGRSLVETWGLPEHVAAWELPPQGPLDVPHTAAFASCALVSSSAQLLHSQCGADIDRHQIIMRINGAPTKGYEKHVGRRTHLRLQHSEYYGWRESSHEVLIAKWQGKLAELQDLVRLKVHPINPAFIRHTRNAYFAKKGHIPTQGLRALALLLHVCRRVDIYGFDGPLFEWYFDKVSNRSAKSKRQHRVGVPLERWNLIAGVDYSGSQVAGGVRNVSGSTSGSGPHQENKVRHVEDVERRCIKALLAKGLVTDRTSRRGNRGRRRKANS